MGAGGMMKCEAGAFRVESFGFVGCDATGCRLGKILTCACFLRTRLAYIHMVRDRCHITCDRIRGLLSSSRQE